MWTERLSESASWMLVGAIAFAHALWFVGWWSLGRRLGRARPADVLAAGPDAVARARRRTNVALLAGALGLVAQLVAVATFLVVATVGQSSVAEVRADSYGARDIIVRDHDAPGFPEWDRADADFWIDHDVPVVWGEVAGVRFFQIGDEPGVVTDVACLALFELAAALFLVAFTVVDARRLPMTERPSR